ncbi:hypothetical protein BOX15_Mlig013435g1 [Macrostomum lignano]|uniref:Cystatin domain-containing protein n=1 Tax=Macrostomum lignano TaxID=282301 RepID=A0A267EKK8_9PLAT|nr:hypothetical protein BOX15_Mlig013435g1 [Macrostomum lignano]
MKCVILLSVVAFSLAGVAIGSLIGGKSPLTEADVKSPEFRGALDMATLEMNRLSSHSRFYAVLNFMSGTKQVVAGVFYEFSVVLRATECDNHKEQNLENLAKCSPVNLPGASEFRCNFKVLYQPWSSNSAYRVMSEPSCVSPW